MQNLHTHSVWCDGKDRPRDMVLSAIGQGFDSLGFSSHVHTGFPEDPAGIRTSERQDRYIAEVKALREEFSDRISIYTGLEMEYVTAAGKYPNKDERLDYAIGAVHYLMKDGHFFSVDNDPKTSEKGFSLFGGERPLIERYYSEVAEFARHSDYDITAHIDLVTKFNEKTGWDFEKESWYRDAALYAAETAAENGKIVEVNTGAISRGWRTAPYPAPFILEHLRSLDAPVTITSDCHDRNFLTCNFRESREMLSAMGFREIWVLTDEGFRPEPL